MPFQQSDGVRFYQFESFDHPGLFHAILSRRGGVSPKPWASLNLGGTVGDDPERVATNKRLAFEALNLNLERTYEVWLTHSALVYQAKAARVQIV